MAASTAVPQSLAGKSIYPIGPRKSALGRNLPSTRFRMTPPPDSTQRVRYSSKELSESLILGENWATMLNFNYAEPVTTLATVEKPQLLLMAENPVEPPYVENYRGSYYLMDFLDPKELKKKVALVVRALRNHRDKFDAIAFTGMSGTLIGPPVAMKLDKSVIMVRKPDTSTHSSYEVEGDYGARRYIILDDLRASGQTEHRIVTSIAKAIPDAKYVGFFSGREIDEYDAERHYHGASPFRPKYNYEGRI